MEMLRKLQGDTANDSNVLLRIREFLPFHYCYPLVCPIGSVPIRPSVSLPRSIRSEDASHLLLKDHESPIRAKLGRFVPTPQSHPRP